MASEEKDKGFTVQDRRRFSAEGEAKAEVTEEAPASAAASAPKAAGGRPAARWGAGAACGTGGYLHHLHGRSLDPGAGGAGRDLGPGFGRTQQRSSGGATANRYNWNAAGEDPWESRS